MTGRVIAAVLAGCLAGAAFGVSENEMTEEEKKALPAWCAVSMAFDRQPRAPGHFDDMVQRYGEGWKHVHHYCWALASVMRYHSADPDLRNKSHWAKSAIGDIDYVLRNAQPDFLLNREMMLRKVRLQISERWLTDAEKTARELVQRWPEFADSHGALAEVQLAASSAAEARRTLSAAAAVVKDGSRLDQIRRGLRL
jgi:hypothetical protein